jgi:hypothetical protein
VPATEIVVLPTLNELAWNAVKFLSAGTDTVIIGPPGCGLTTVCLPVVAGLAGEQIPCQKLDCRPSSGEPESGLVRLRKLQADPRSEQSQLPVLVVDHASDLEEDEFAQFVLLLNANPGIWRARFWLGQLDVRSIAKRHGLTLNGHPRAHLHFPELSQHELLAIYRKIAARQSCHWGEALLYFALDWCGGDFSLLDGLAEHFYGDWSDRIYDETVADCLNQWLKTDARVAAYQQRVRQLPESCARYQRILSCGGKLPRHGPELYHETDAALRRMFFAGLLCGNLLPRYYTVRHLVGRCALTSSLSFDKPFDAFSLLRRSANERVNALLQEVELVLRNLLLAVIERYPTEDWQGWFASKKTDEQFIAPNLHEALLNWAMTEFGDDAGQDTRTKLARFLAEQRKVFHLSHNLWTKLCERWQEAKRTDGEPLPGEAVQYLTFNEAADAVQSLHERIFPAANWAKIGIDSPRQRWPIYFSRIRRLRNNAAHLRNMGFQDVEDMLADVRSLRDDLVRFAFEG